jgi:hypothetical protein
VGRREGRGGSNDALAREESSVAVGANDERADVETPFTTKRAAETAELQSSSLLGTHKCWSQYRAVMFREKQRQRSTAVAAT